MAAIIGAMVGMVLLAVVMAGVVSAIIILVDAFKNSVADGLLSLLVPFYILYYMFAKFRHPKKTFFIATVMMQPFILLMCIPFAIYGIRRYIANAKQAEARASVMAIARGIVEYTHSQDGQGSGARVELPLSAPAVPALLSHVRGMKYQSAPSDWSGTWQQIRFAMADPQYFQYQWDRISATKGVVRALGDLDGDGEVDVRIELPVQCIEQAQSLDCRIPPEAVVGTR
jgi:hypothetical protein